MELTCALRSFKEHADVRNYSMWRQTYNANMVHWYVAISVRMHVNLVHKSLPNSPIITILIVAVEVHCNIYANIQGNTQ